MILSFVSVILRASRHSAAALGLLLVAGGAAAAQDGDDWKAESFKLDNGMTAVVLPDHRAPVVTHVIWYRVGAADEVPGKSGLAHFLEHLMFKATETTPAGERAFCDRADFLDRHGPPRRAGTA